MIVTKCVCALVAKQAQEVLVALLAHTLWIHNRGCFVSLCVGSPKWSKLLNYLLRVSPVESYMHGSSLQLLLSACKSTEVVQSTRPINTIRGEEVFVLQSAELSSHDHTARPVQHVVHWQDVNISRA